MASSPTRASVDPSRACRCESRKVGYATYDRALDVAELMMEKGEVNPGCHITPYACDDCGEWHVANRVIVPIGRKWRRNG